MRSDLEAFRPGPHEWAPTVMQVLPALHSGGVERGAVDVARALVSAGWKALVVSGGGPMANELVRAGADHVTVPIGAKNPLLWRRNYRALVDIARQRDVDIIHARSRMPAWIAWRAARACRLPFVTTFHGRYRDSNRLKKIHNAVMGRGDRVIAISNYIAGEVARRYGIGDDRLRTIPRGIDLARHDPKLVGADRMHSLAESWRLPDGVPVIMLPGRVTRWKGHELLVEALSRLDDLPFHCVIVGPYHNKERYRRHLETRIACRQLGEKVRLTGACADMPAAYMLSDLVVSTSIDPEPFGRVIVEAQAMGRPVVAGNHGGAAETIIDGRTGWLVAPGDADALASAIRKALTMTNDERARIAATAIEHARRHYSQELMCARTLAVYCELLQRPPAAL